MPESYEHNVPKALLSSTAFSHNGAENELAISITLLQHYLMLLYEVALGSEKTACALHKSVCVQSIRLAGS